MFQYHNINILLAIRMQTQTHKRSKTSRNWLLCYSDSKYSDRRLFFIFFISFQTLVVKSKVKLVDWQVGTSRPCILLPTLTLNNKKSIKYMLRQRSAQGMHNFVYKTKVSVRREHGKGNKWNQFWQRNNTLYLLTHPFCVGFAWRH